MAAKRKIDDCAEHRVTLCDNNLLIAQAVKAKMKRQASMSDVINKIVAEFALRKDHGLL